MKNFKIGLKYFLMSLSILLEIAFYSLCILLLWHLPLAIAIIGISLIILIGIYSVMCGIRKIGLKIKLEIYKRAMKIAQTGEIDG